MLKKFPVKGFQDYFFSLDRPALDEGQQQLCREVSFCLNTTILGPCSSRNTSKPISKEGIDIWGFTVENEPLGNDSNWDSMHYSPDEMTAFVINHLGPQLEESGHGRGKDFRI